MNIYFQEGEFTNGGTDWSNFLLQLAGFLVTIFAAYYGAKKAVTLQIDKEAEETKTELQDKFNFLNSLAARANKSIVNQVNFLKEFYNSINLKPSFTHEHKRIALDDVKRVLILLGEEKTFKAYLKKFNQDAERHENYNKMVYLLDYYFNGLNSIIMNIELTSKEIHEKRTVFSSHFNIFQRELLLFMRHPHFINTEAFYQVDIMLNTSYSKEEREDLQIVCTKIIIPIQDLLAQSEITDGVKNEIIMIGRDCIRTKEQIEELNLTYAEFFRGRHLEFTTQLENLKMLIEKLNVK
jgi:hypothetical protein